MASHARTHTQFDHVTFPSIHRHAHRSASTELDSVFEPVDLRESCGNESGRDESLWSIGCGGVLIFLAG